MLWSCAALSGAAAQSAGVPATVRGTVYDSVAGAPLASATVQLAPRSGTAAPRSVITDSAGAYSFDSVAPGEYFVDFYHEALTALGIDAPTRAISVAASDVVGDLAVPSSETLRTLRCGERHPYAPGMLVGTVLDAQTRASPSGVTVTIEWRAFALDSANYRVVRETREGAVEPDGTRLVCHLPVEVPLELVVNAPAHREVRGTVVNIPARGIGRLDVLLADSGRSIGTAIVRGRVKRENGKPVASGQVTLNSLGREVAVKDGDFTVANVPAGTWVARARVIGLDPQDVLVTAADSAVVATTITVPNGSQRLDAVTVIGKRDRNLDVLDDVLRRQRIGMGTTFLPGHPALRSAIWVSDVMREARGFYVPRPDSVVGRANGGSRCPFVDVYVDDMRQPDGFKGVYGIVSPREVLAIETWPDILLAPVQYRRSAPPEGLASRRFTRDGSARSPEPAPCALVLIWTRRKF
ncbi:MAG: MSCRAMM family protein [Gemmatimonadaceae bacterium]